MTILLAPMEGLLDHPLRQVLTAVGGIDRCVSPSSSASPTSCCPSGCSPG
jgi:tRNA-dihydrouridine synthase